MKARAPKANGHGGAVPGDAAPDPIDRRPAIRVRMGLVCGVLSMGLGVIVSSGWSIMVGDGDAWREEAELQRQRRLHVLPKRGAIYDRNGTALAVTVEVPSASVDAVELLRRVRGQQVPVVARDAANRIARALDLDPAAVERKILAKRRFAWLKRRITAEESSALRVLMRGEDGGEPISGLVVEGEGRRYYPRRQVAGPLLGFVAPDGEGKDGVELTLNSRLQGTVEQVRGMRDRSGKLIFSHGMQDDRALAGHDVYLTIDQGLQFAAERELAAAVQTFEAVGGSVIIVEPNTGELLAMASWPAYNPNDYSESAVEARRDRGITDQFEPGSTMKIFTVALGLAEGAITPTQRMYCEKGAMRVDNVTIRDTHASEWLSVSQVLSQSSNICSAKIGLSMGGSKLYEGLRRFGFGLSAGLPLPGESSGVLRPRGRPWVQVETAAAAFGQGIGVTNLQLAMATAAIANGGRLMEPIIVKKTTTASGEIVDTASPKVRHQVVPVHIARTLSEMLVGVTEGEGTGVEAALSGYVVAGKTATAQKTDPATGRYSLEKYVASFVGYVPANKPRLAISIVIDEPMLEHAGGAVAAPVFRRLARTALEYVGLTPKGTKPVDLASLAREPDPAHAVGQLLRENREALPSVQEHVKGAVLAGGQVRVPEITGWPVREAVRKLIELGLTPEVRGTGLLVRQNPAPGAPLGKGERVVLEFEPAT